MTATHTPTVTVVIPAYNEEARVGRAVEAAMRQSYPAGAMSVIVIDDGSNDETAAVARAAGATVIRQPNAGPAAARNRGAAFTDSDFVVFTDADCEPHNDMVERLVSAFEDAPSTDLVMGAYKTKSARLVGRLAQLEFEERYDLMGRAAEMTVGATYSLAMRRSVFLDLGGFDEAFPSPNGEDFDLAMRLKDQGGVLRHQRDAVVFHDHHDSWSDYFRVKSSRAFWRLHLYRRHPDRVLADGYTPSGVKLQVVALLAAGASGGIASIRHSRAVSGFAAGSAAVLVGSAAPFVRTAARHDRALLPWTVPFVVFRAAALASGVLRSLRPRNLARLFVRALPT